MNKDIFVAGIALMFLFSISLASSALFISNTVQDTVYPGDSGALTISLKNDFDYDIEDVSLSLDLSETRFTAIGSSEKNMDEIKDGDKEDFKFTIKSASDLSPGDYLIPYTISYAHGNTSTLAGFIGVSVKSKISLDYSVFIDKPIVGEKSRLGFKIINKGFGEIKFASVTIEPSGYKLLSSEKVYIGLVNSDSFETASYDVIFTKENARLIATVSYLDFENNEKSELVDLPLEIYSQEEAKSLGIISSSNSMLYLLVLGIAVVLFIIIKRIRKKKKLQRERA